MTLQVSTNFKTQLLAGFPAIFDGGVIAIYDGPRPATADDAVLGLLLGYVSRNGGFWAPGDTANGLIYEASGPYISKPVASTWSVAVTRNGTASWFRMVGPESDSGALSYDVPRIDGDISDNPASGAEMILPDVTLVAGNVVDLDAFTYTITPIVGS